MTGFPQDDRDPLTDGWPDRDDIIRKYPPDDQNRHKDCSRAINSTSGHPAIHRRVSKRFPEGEPIMSNHMHLECWSHEPHIVGAYRVGQHDEDLPAIRAALTDRGARDHASPGLRASEAQNLALFLDRHPGCDIRVVDEAGNDRTEDDEPPVFPMVLMRPDGTASTSIPPASFRAILAQGVGRIRSVIIITEEADA